MKLNRMIYGLVILFVISFVAVIATIIRLQAPIEQTAGTDEERERLVIYTWDDNQQILQRAADAFMRVHPESRVEVLQSPSSEYTQRLNIALNDSHSQVDIMAFATPAGASWLVAKGEAMELSREIETWDTSGYDAILAGMQDDDAVYRVPYRNSAWVVYCNRELFERAGFEIPEGDWTWEEYATLAARISARLAGVYGTMNFSSDQSWWRVPARTAGAENPMIPEDLEEFARTAEWNYHLTYDLHAAVPYTELTGIESRDYTARFLNGECAMMVCGEWCLNMLQNERKSEDADFRYDVAKLPHWDGREAHAIGTPAVVCIAKDTEHRELSLDFVRYLCGEEGAEILAAEGYIPAWNSDRVREIFKSGESMPEHSDYFFPTEEVSFFPATTEYSVGMDLVHQAFWSYFLNERTLEETLQDCRRMLAERNLGR